MKHTLKRILSLVMALALICSALPVQTFALAQPQLPGRIFTAETEISLNPLYEGLVDEEQLLSRLPQVPDAEIAADAAAEYTDEAGAVEQLREAMVNRLGTAVISFATTDTDYSAQMTRIFQTALKHTGNPVEGDYLMWQYGAWKASASYYIEGETRYYTTTFTLTYYTTAEQEKTVDTAVEELLNTLDLDGKTDYEKVRGIYDYICANVTYDYENLNDKTYTLKHSAYAALIDGTAVCQGYALLLYRLAMELGVDCRIVAGLGGGGAHGWNILGLEGLYYNADSTWDAGNTVYSWFLVSEENFPNHTRGDYSGTNGMNYVSEAFYAEYPMGAENYTPHVPEVIAGGTCGDNLTWALDDVGTLTVSGTGAMADFTSSGQPWREYKQQIRSVVIGEGVTRVGDYAFFHCYGLTKVNLPDTVVSIGSSAFFYCDALPGVELPEGLQYIEDHAFGSCDVLTGVEFPGALKSIGVTAFSGTGLTSAILPEGIESVGKQAFMGCPLTEAVIPASVESLGYCAFQDCAPLDFISVDANNPVYCNDGQGAVYTKDMTKLIVVPAGFAGEFVIPQSVTAVSGCALRNCDGLTAVSIPETVSSIGEMVFYDCAILDGVVWPATAVTVPRSAFSWCKMLSSVTLPEGVTVLDQSAFYGCESLREMEIPSTVTEMGSNCLAQSGLEQITFLGDSPVFVNENTFSGITATAYYPTGNESWTEEVMQNYDGSITWIPYGPEDFSANVIRLSGKDRYLTAFAVANQLKEKLGVTRFETVVVAYGRNFPDALTGSYLAAVMKAPILLTEKSADSKVLAYIQENLIPGGKVYILGGTAAVTESFEIDAKAKGFDVERLKDKDRYGTNLAILREAGIRPGDEILIATGTNYADSLSASATGLPMLLVGGSLTEAQKAFLATTSGKFVIIGGTGAVSQKVEDQLNEIGTAVRVKGKTRYETSVVIAQRFFDAPKSVALAYAQDFPDGLCGGPLAYVVGAPLILTSGTNYASADSYIEGMTSGFVTGGTGRLTDEVVRKIFDLPENAEIPKT